MFRTSGRVDPDRKPIYQHPTTLTAPSGSARAHASAHHVAGSPPADGGGAVVAAAAAATEPDRSGAIICPVRASARWTVAHGG